MDPSVNSGTCVANADACHSSLPKAKLVSGKRTCVANTDCDANTHDVTDNFCVKKHTVASGGDLAAIVTNAQEGDIIEPAAATFNHNLVITKGLTIKGKGID